MGQLRRCVARLSHADVAHGRFTGLHGIRHGVLQDGKGVIVTEHDDAVLPVQLGADDVVAARRDNVAVSAGKGMCAVEPVSLRDNLFTRVIDTAIAGKTHAYADGC